MLCSAQRDGLCLPEQCWGMLFWESTRAWSYPAVPSTCSVALSMDVQIPPFASVFIYRADVHECLQDLFNPDGAINTRAKTSAAVTLHTS